MNATKEFMYTSVVRDENMASIESLKLCPQIFHPLVEKRCERRVIVVGDRVFAGAIDASNPARGRVDWRLTGPDEGVSWTRAELSSGVEGKVLALLRRLDLRYGAADFIVTPDGRNVFLEVNAVGEFFWLQRNPGAAHRGGHRRRAPRPGAAPAGPARGMCEPHGGGPSRWRSRTVVRGLNPRGGDVMHPLEREVP